MVGVEAIFSPQMGATASSEAAIPILLRNDSAAAVTMDVAAIVPDGWAFAKGVGQYSLRPHESRTVTVFIPTPQQGNGPRKVHVTTTGPTGPIAVLAVDVTVVGTN